MNKVHLFCGSYAKKVGVIPTWQELVNNSFATVFVRKRVMFDVSEHPKSLKKLDFSSYDPYIATQFVT